MGGAKASFKELAASMNEKSEALGEGRSSISLHREQVRNWFREQGGKEYSAKEKPLDTDEHKRKRLEWIRKWQSKLRDPNTHLCYLDEKFFYVTNRRRKIKRLPLDADEKEGCDSLATPKMRNRRYPVKCMYLGVVGNPIPAKQVDGRIHLERVSKSTMAAKKSVNQRFSDDRNINNALNDGA